MKTKLEYLVYEPQESHHPWRVLICHDDMIVGRKSFMTIGALMEDAVSYRRRRYQTKVEMRSGAIVALARLKFSDLAQAQV